MMIRSEKSILFMALSLAGVVAAGASEPTSTRSADTQVQSAQDQVMISVKRYDADVSVADFVDYETHNENGKWERIQVPLDMASDIKGVLRHHENVSRVRIHDEQISIPEPPTQTGVSLQSSRDWEGSDEYTDPGFHRQTHFAQVGDSLEGSSGILEAQQVSEKQADLSIAVIDGPFDEHRDFTWSGGYDFAEDDPDTWKTVFSNSDDCSLGDGDYHGQWVGSVMGAHQDSGQSIAGIADANYYGARVGECGESPEFTSTIDAIYWASGHEPDGVEPIGETADIINLSLGGEAPCFDELQTAIDVAISEGAIVVASAGNENEDTENYSPANCEGVVTVASTTRDGDKSDFSNFGSEVDFSALGSGVPVQVPDGFGDYMEINGTSFSAPNVAGMLALFWKQVPEMDNVSVVMEALNATTPVQGGGSGMGEGILNATLLFEEAALLGDYEVRHPLSGTCSESPSRSLLESDSDYCDLREIRVGDDFYDSDKHYAVFDTDSGERIAHSTDQRFMIEQWDKDAQYGVTFCDELEQCDDNEKVDVDLANLDGSFDCD